jgi:aryl-alcohol dehydrogenase-like predicted oxidoreductase
VLKQYPERAATDVNLGEGFPMIERITIDRYRLLGRSGLRVSPLSLGTMTFGTDWGWGADQSEARRIFSAYVECGGNFIDTANQYTNGTAEQLVGNFAIGMRDNLVIATKYTLPTRPGDPNSGGNSRKSMVGSVETSLRRLKTDYIDLLYLHAWDSTTPVEEILRAMDDLVRAGKVLYVGISDTAAWQVSRMQAIADLRGWCPLVALQIQYSLLQRTVEHELIPMAREIGLGVVPWSPLAGGILAGKYQKNHVDLNLEKEAWEGSRRHLVVESGALTERNIGIAELVRTISLEVGKSPAQISLAWTLLNSGVTSSIIGARTLKQLQENLGALDVNLPEVKRVLLEKASAVDPTFPHDYLAWLMTSSYMRTPMNISSLRD